jgi:hypothetical protein
MLSPGVETQAKQHSYAQEADRSGRDEVEGGVPCHRVAQGGNAMEPAGACAGLLAPIERGRRFLAGAVALAMVLAR